MSTDLNSVFLIGRLTRDVELTYLQSGSAVARFSLAVNRSTKSGDQWVDEASYFDVSLYGKQAESLKQYLLKGKQIGVQGSLKQDRWEKDGQKFSKVAIIANNVELLGGGQSQGGSYGQPQGGYSQPQNGYQQRPPMQNSYAQQGAAYGGQPQQGNPYGGYPQAGAPGNIPSNGYPPPPQDNFPQQEFPEDIPF